MSQSCLKYGRLSFLCSRLSGKRHFNKSTQQYDGQSHTHPQVINVEHSGVAHPVKSDVTYEPTFEEVQNIANGAAKKIQKK